MSDFKGTPGPWYRGGVENNKVSINAGNYFVALVDESSAQLANARLIAAAPELLYALQLIIKDLRTRAKVRGDIDDDGTVVLDIGSGVLMKANDAISKALGQ